MNLQKKFEKTGAAPNSATLFQHAHMSGAVALFAPECWETIGCH